MNRNTKVIPVIVAAVALASVPALLAQGCCGGGAMKEGCSMMGGMGGSTAAGEHAGHGGGTAATSAQNASPKVRLTQPVQAVFDNYVKVQQALAQDFLEGVPTSAQVMAKTIRSDSSKALSQNVAAQAEALGRAKDLEAARAAFKPLSESLIQYLKDQKVPAGTYHEAYCPMAKASWLQTGSTVMNPYMGKAMVHCGQFKS